MKKLLILCALIGLTGALRAGETNAARIAVYFSPAGGCTQAIVNEIDRAKSTILVQAYSFSSAPIARALVEAHKRGVNVQLIIDKSVETEEHSSANTVLRGGVTVLEDAQHSIAHNKVMVLDSQVVITGSFNFTHAAETYNAENVLVIRDRDLARKYGDNWREHAAHSKPYAPRRTE